MGEIECCKKYGEKQNRGKICSCDKSVIWVRFKTAKHVNNTGKSYKNPCRIFKIFLRYSLFACFYVTAELKSLTPKLTPLGPDSPAPIF